MAVGDILDETIRLYRQNFRVFVGVAAVLQIPLVILQLVQFAIAGPAIYDFIGTGPGGVPQFQTGPLIFWIASTVALGIVSFLFFLVIEAALATAISQRYLGRQVTVGQAYRVALTRFWRMLGTSLISGIALLLLVLTFLGIPVAIFLGIRWSFFVQAIVLEGRGVRASLSRSTALVKGTWWRVFGVFIVGFMAQYLVSAIPGGLIGAIIGAIGALIMPNALLTFSAISTVIGSLFGILAAPVLPTIGTLLYYDLRIRKEGFDLQVLAERLDHGRSLTFEGKP